MSVLARHLEDYLRLRRMLGHKLDDAARQLPWFVDYLDAAGHDHVTTAAALAWSLDRDWPAGSTVPGHRMTAVRGFARYLAGIDPRIEVPPPGLIRIPRTWRAPFIYTDDDVLALMHAARRSIREPLRAATYDSARAARHNRLADRRGAAPQSRRHQHRRRGAHDPPLEVRQVAPSAAATEHARGA
jgi:hypothetical protein